MYIFRFLSLYCLLIIFCQTFHSSFDFIYGALYYSKSLNSFAVQSITLYLSSFTRFRVLLRKFFCSKRKPDRD